MLTPRIVEAKPQSDFSLRLTYESGDIRVFDVKPYIRGSWFCELADYDYFKRVAVVDGGIEWPNGQDIAPHEMWESGEKEDYYENQH